VFLHLLYENKPVISEQALWGIGNIAGDCHAFRDMVLTKGGLECLIRIVENTNVSSLMRHGIWALSNLCRGAPLPHYDMIKPAISVIARAILSGFIEGDVLSDSLWVLASHCEGQKSRIQRLV
jgi:importin subunit alpha-6/7